MTNRLFVFAVVLAIMLNACGYADHSGVQPTETSGQEVSEIAEVAPSITSLEPATGSGSVDVETVFAATFSGPVSVDTSQVQLLVDGTVAAVDVTGEANVITLTPQTSLPYDVSVEVRFAPGAVSGLQGQPFAGISADEWKVTTQTEPDTTAPMVLWNAPGSLTSSDKQGANPHYASKQIPIVIPVTLSEEVRVVDPNGIVLSVCVSECLPQATTVELVGPDKVEVRFTNKKKPFIFQRDYQLAIESGALADAAGNPVTRHVRYFRFEGILTLPRPS